MSKKISLILLFLWPIFASLVSFLTKADFFVLTVLFLGVPSVFLSFLSRKKIKRAAFFSLFFSVPIAIVIGFIMEAAGGGHLPHPIFGPLELFGLIGADLVFWGILEAYLILMFYETFLDKADGPSRMVRGSPKLSRPRFKYIFIAFYFVLETFILLYMFKPELLVTNYFYLKMGVVLAVLPIFGMLIKFPKFWHRFLSIAVYFFVFNFIYEVTAVKLGQWSFPAAKQLTKMTVFMGARFAFEELFFWALLAAMAVVAFFKFFDDDQKTGFLV